MQPYISKRQSPANGLSPVTSQVHVDAFHITTILSNQDVTINLDHEVTKDEALILALGYKQELRREFSLWSIFCVSFSVLGLLPSIAACFDYQQLVIGMSPIPWILAILFITSVALSMAEVSSVWPCSSGTPYAVSQLAPKKYAPLLTWLTCFSNWMCQITAAPSVNYSCACLMLALYSYQSPGYSPTNGQIYGLTTGIQVSHAILSSMPTKFLAKFNNLGTILNMIFLTIVFVMILAGNDRQALHENIPKFNSNATAWSLTNQTEFPTGIAMLMSFLGVIWAMSGYDSPYHISEECASPELAVPRAITLTATCGGAIGFVFMLAIAYTLVDLEYISEDPLGLGQPFVLYLSLIFSNKKLVLAATSMTVISSYFMGGSCMFAASRVTYAYSRDGLFPLSRYWKLVNPITQTPVNAVWINMFLGQLLLLLLFAGDVAIGAIFSVGGIAGFVSFTVPTALKVTVAHKTFRPGPWNLGKFSRPIGFVTCAFVLVMIPILCFPYVKGKDLDAEQMNWTVVVFFGPMLLSLIWFMVDAHKWYKGPRSNIEAELITYGSRDAALIREPSDEKKESQYQEEPSNNSE